MFCVKKKNFSGAVYSFKESEKHEISVDAFKRIGKDGEPVVYVKGLEKIDESRKENFLREIQFELGSTKIEPAMAEYLASNNETWFNIFQRVNKNSALPEGRFVARNLNNEEIASLGYSSRGALISGKPEIHISLSSKYAPNGVYDQLLYSFVQSMNNEFCSSGLSGKGEYGFTGYFSVGEEDMQGCDLVKKMESNPKKYNLKSCSCLGQSEEDYSEKQYCFKTLPVQKEDKYEVIQDKGSKDVQEQTLVA